MGNIFSRETKTNEAVCPIPVDVIKKLFEKCKKSVLRVNTIHHLQGTAAFYKIETLQNDHFCLISALHVINSNDKDEISRAELRFDNDMPFRLLPDWIVSVVTDTTLDAAVIEICEYKAKEIISNGTNFFFIHPPHDGDKV